LVSDDSNDCHSFRLCLLGGYALFGGVQKDSGAWDTACYWSSFGDYRCVYFASDGLYTMRCVTMNNFTETIIFVGGVYNLGFAVFHLMFWRLFRWKKDMASLTFTNRSIMQILNLCLIFIFLVMAYVSFFHSPELIQTSLGKTILILFSLFWFLRTIEQVIFFGVKTRVSVAFTMGFLLGSMIYLVPVLLAKP